MINHDVAGVATEDDLRDKQMVRLWTTGKSTRTIHKARIEMAVRRERGGSDVT